MARRSHPPRHTAQQRYHHAHSVDRPSAARHQGSRSGGGCGAHAFPVMFARRRWKRACTRRCSRLPQTLCSCSCQVRSCRATRRPCRRVGGLVRRLHGCCTWVVRLRCRRCRAWGMRTAIGRGRVTGSWSRRKEGCGSDRLVYRGRAGGGWSYRGLAWSRWVSCCLDQVTRSRRLQRGKQTESGP